MLQSETLKPFSQFFCCSFWRHCWKREEGYASSAKSAAGTTSGKMFDILKFYYSW